MAQARTATVATTDAATPQLSRDGQRSKFRMFLINTGRSAVIGAISGATAGFFVGGIGSRVAMRIIAAVGGDGISGMESENGNIVGDITAGGILALFILGTILGGLVGQIYMLVRRWLPGPTWLRSGLFGVFMVLLVGNGPLDRNNSDFLRFTPILSVALFALLPLLYGVIQVPVAEWLYKKLPPTGQLRTPVGFYTLAAAIVPLSFLFLLSVAVFQENPTWNNVLPLVAPALIYALGLLGTYEAQRTRRPPGQVSSVVRFGGYGLLCIAAGTGSYVLLGSVNFFLF